MEEKPLIHSLFRDDPKTPEGKYLVKRRDGTVVEWPSFVLGARDPHAVAALEAYADSLFSTADRSMDLAEQQALTGLAWSVRKLAATFDSYRESHGNGDPERGRHRKDDPATIAEMRKGMSA